MSFSSKKSSKKDVGSGDESAGEHTVKLSNSRFLTVSEFKNRVRVDIREFYLDADGVRKPGRKGISLSLEEWKKIVDNLDVIKTAIKQLDSDDSD